MASKKRLGKGLGALIAIEEEIDKGVKEIDVNQIEPNTSQPRRVFDKEKLSDLSDSIKKHGIVQPIIVNKEGDIYRIVVGERRWRAAKLAGLVKIPAIVRDLEEREILEIALIENLQREDLNPIEEAQAYYKLLIEFKMTQENISEAVGKSRSTIANSLRLLNLNDEIKKKIEEGIISGGHGRSLLSLEDMALQVQVLKEIIKEGLSVRETERLVKVLNEKAKKPKTLRSKDEKTPEIKAIEEELQATLGTKVKLNNSKNRGKIVIEYYSNEDLERIIERLRKSS